MVTSFAFNGRRPDRRIERRGSEAFSGREFLSPAVRVIMPLKRAAQLARQTATRSERIL